MANILIIEDNDMLNQSYEMMLSFHGHQVQTAFNGKQGLERLSMFTPDVILLDYFMPVMDGRDFLIEFKPHEHPESKVVLLTNIDDLDKINEAYKLGISSYLLKANMAPDELVDAVNRLLVVS